MSKELDLAREALREIAEWSAPGVAGNVVPVIHKIAKKALDSTDPKRYNG